MATSTIKKDVTIETGVFACSLTADSDNILSDNNGAGSELVTWGTLPSNISKSIFIVESVGSNNKCLVNFHTDGTVKKIHAYTNVTQSVNVRWYQFNL